MSTVSFVQLANAFLKPVVLGLVCLPLVVAAQANKPTFSGPSVVQSSKPADFSGSGFAPNSAVSVSIARAGGAEAHYGAVVGADGKLIYKATPTAAGPHVLKVLDSAGKALATVNFIAH